MDFPDAYGAHIGFTGPLNPRPHALVGKAPPAAAEFAQIL